MYVRPISIVSLLTELLLPVCVVRADDDTTLGMLADDVVQEVKHVGYVCVTRPNCVVTVINQSMALVGCLSGCTGDCFYCTKSNVLTYACVKRTGECTFGGQGSPGTYKGGNKFRGGCKNGSPTATWMHDINGCVCQMTTGEDTGEECILSKCY